MDDLDSLLDDTPIELQAVPVSKPKPKVKASNAFLSSKKKADGLAAGMAPSFLPEDACGVWSKAMKASASTSRPQGSLSNAYKCFNKASEGIVVHGAEEGGGAQLASGLASIKYSENLQAALGSAGVLEPSQSVPENAADKARLQKLYLQQLALDLKEQVASDPDYLAEPDRFPHLRALLSSS